MLDAWPHLGEAKTGLGLLAMRLGQEDEARKVLSQAFEADKFNVRVANSLKVLRHLNNYATIATEHFQVRYDAKTDAILGPYMADALEREYSDSRPAFNFDQPGRF